MPVDQRTAGVGPVYQRYFPEELAVFIRKCGQAVGIRHADLGRNQNFWPAVAIQVALVEHGIAVFHQGTPT